MRTRRSASQEVPGPTPRPASPGKTEARVERVGGDIKAAAQPKLKLSWKDPVAIPSQSRTGEEKAERVETEEGAAPGATADAGAMDLGAVRVAAMDPRDAAEVTEHVVSLARQEKRLPPASSRTAKKRGLVLRFRVTKDSF
jgi:hypothetical protein